MTAILAAGVLAGCGSSASGAAGSASTDEAAEKCMEQLDRLNGCEVHSSVILASVDEQTFHKLGVNLTCDPHYQTKKLFHG